MLDLFRQYPGLAENLPFVEIMKSPTPVQLITPLNSKIGVDNLFVKRDDLTSVPYGGNKVRKLEFLLGKAIDDGLEEVLTYGGAGSNHALATAIYAKKVGLKSISLLSIQHNAHSVRRNLLMGHKVGAELHHFMEWRDARQAECDICDRHEDQTGKRPYVIPPGGSSPLGTIGFVNAGFELSEQIKAGILPQPDRIYVACGTMGTCMGLLLGFRAYGLKTSIYAVQVTDAGYCSLERSKNLFKNTNELLHEADSDFPILEFPEDLIVLRPEFYGPDYGMHTPEAVEAIKCASGPGLKLEGTYTGKTFAALLEDARAGELKDKTVIFWNTYNSHDFSTEIESIDYHELPPGFHRYFEEDVQPLDRKGE